MTMELLLTSAPKPFKCISMTQRKVTRWKTTRRQGDLANEKGFQPNSKSWLARIDHTHAHTYIHIHTHRHTKKFKTLKQLKKRFKHAS